MKIFLHSIVGAAAIAFAPAWANAHEHGMPTNFSVSEEVPKEVEDKTIASIGKIISITEIDQVARAKHFLSPESKLEENLIGLDEKFLLNHLFKFQIISKAKFRDSVALGIKPSFKVLYADGSKAIITPFEASIYPKEGKPFRCKLNPFQKNKSQTGTHKSQQGKPQ